MNQAYEKALEREETNRLLAYLHIAEPLLGCPTVAITWRIYFELLLAGNAYLTAGEPKRESLYILLWRLHPWFRRPDGSMPNLPSGTRRPGRLMVFMVRLSIWKLAHAVNLNATERAVRQRINDAFQDSPTTSSTDQRAPSSLRPAINIFDDVSAYFLFRGCGLGMGIFDANIAWTLQMVRAHALQTDPSASNKYIPPSAALYGSASSQEPSDQSEARSDRGY